MKVNIILSVALYGCETWSIVTRVGHKLMVFENRVLTEIFGAKWNEVTGDWRRLHIEEHYDLYCLPNTILVIKSRRMGWAGHVARMVERKGAYWILVGRPE
jgi:hypothetical protein